MTINVTLGCNATSLLASDPVGWGEISTALTALLAVYNFGFWGTTFYRSITVGNPKDWSYPSYFWGVDFVFLQFFWLFTCIGFVIWALTAYVQQNSSFVTTSYPTTGAGYDVFAPQDVFNLFCLSIGMAMLTFYKFYQCYLIKEGKVDVKGWLLENENKSKAEIFFLTYVPPTMLFAICVFGAIFGYLQDSTNHRFCKTEPVTWFQYSGGGGVGWAHLVSGLILAFCIIVRYFGPLRSMKDMSFNSRAVFYAGPSRFNAKRAILMGWLPCVRIGFWWCMAFSFYYAQILLFTHHDFYKVLGAYFAVSFVSIVLTAYSGTIDSFPAWFFSCLFYFHGLQYCAAALVVPTISVSPAVVPAQKTIDWGLFSTGPALAADVDQTSVQVFVYFELAFSIAVLYLEILAKRAEEKSKDSSE